MTSLFFRRLRNTYDDPILRKYHRQGFWIKIIGCFAFTIFSVYLSPGDSIGLYQKEGNNIYQLILNDFHNLNWILQKGKGFDETLLKDPWNAGYFKSEANFMVTRIVVILSFITFGRYAAINLLFACLAFSGLWKLFLFFYEQYPHLHKKFAISILYFPTLVFWSSGVLKDTLCIASIGWVTYAVYEMLYRKKSFIKNMLILFFFGYLLAVLKVYILISYLPFFILFIILKNMQGIKNRLLKYMLAPALIFMSMYGFTVVLNSYDEELGGYAVNDLTKSIQHLNGAFSAMDGNETADSNFDLGVEFDGTFKGLIKLAPVAVFTTFFRPFLWESRKLSSLLASLESLVLLFFTIYILFKSGLKTFIKLILSDPLIMYCFIFSIVFALFVGASTLNFGTLVRYKIPCLPFYTISLFLIYEKVREKSLRKTLQKVNNRTKPEMVFSPAFN
ncbi:MAG: hypothetical protein M3Z92_00495 [Bacteroidota bacterium]|nr:hypothetical protein [Bacteroidota bacterium]